MLNYKRTSITMPNTVRQRMEPYHKKINWSAVAAEAFEKFLTDLENGAEVPERFRRNMSQETKLRLMKGRLRALAERIRKLEEGG